ncbi:bifunctional DnaQ family exonuclease/ATP-dependent helicase, partial [Streptococcus agalactiae]|nr:bifunctional DnaQ family exonuclease/ATP-dependent helicase [Streptococcus agalactiae]
SIPLLQKRLLESISYELSHAVELFYRHNSFEFSETWLKRLKNSINALEVVGLDELQTFFTATYTNYWFETDKVNEKRLTILRGAREDFLKFSKFLPPTKKTYMISATLQISPKVYLSDLLGGFSSISTEKIAHEKNANQKVWIDTSMPNILDLSPEQYAYEIAKRLQDIMTLKQPTLVLLTSKQTMFMVSDYLDKWEIKHLTQDKNGLAYNVKKRFDRGESNLLLGTGSFWEGVDFVHRDRLIEVITRLPFDNPKDYFIQKLSQSLTKEGKNFFYDYSLPMTVLKLKQALGRTTRREEQKSAVIILDSRLVIKSYGQTIMHSLGRDFEISKEKINKVLTEMAKFL